MAAELVTHVKLVEPVEPVVLSAKSGDAVQPSTDGSKANSLGGELLSRPQVSEAPKSNAAAESVLHPLQIADNSTAPAQGGKDGPTISDAPTVQETPQQAYDRIHGQFDKVQKVYWDKVAAGKKSHHYVMEFPPVYDGPPKPKPDKPMPVTPNTIPTINEMIVATTHLNEFAFGDKSKPAFKINDGSDADFKQNYAREALRVGQAHGLAKDDVRNIVRSIYAFEDGGWGTHETLSSMPEALNVPDVPGSTAVKDARRAFHLDGATASSALGYNQLLMLNTMDKMTEQSKPIAERLDELSRAQTDPARVKELHDKSVMVAALGPALKQELRAMAEAESRKPPDERKNYYNEDGSFNEQLSRDFGRSKEPTSIGLTRQAMARAVHGLNLDGDVGPIIQAQEFGNLLNYADKYGYQKLLQGKDQQDKQSLADYDALPTDQKAKAVDEVMAFVKPPAPNDLTTQFFNMFSPPADKSLEQKLLAMQPGVDPSLAKDTLTTEEAELVRTKALTIRSVGEASGALSQPAQLLLNKITQSYYGGLDAAKLTPAALELANLSGPKNAQLMLDAKNSDVPTPNFFSQAGYYANPVVGRRTASELLLQIQRSMRGPNFDAQLKPGQADFEKAFNALP